MSHMYFASCPCMSYSILVSFINANKGTCETWRRLSQIQRLAQLLGKGTQLLYTPSLRILIDASCCLEFVYCCVTQAPSICTVKLDGLSFVLLTNDL